MAESAEREDLKKRIAEMREFLDSQTAEVMEYDEQFVRRLIEKITVYDGRFEVEFKSGMKSDRRKNIVRTAPCRNAECFLDF